MTKITKAEFDALPDALKTKFKAEGDDYVLEESTEDVEGLKKSKADILAEKKRIQDERDALAKFKSDHEAAQSKADEELLAKKGEFDTILANKEKAWNERLEAEATKNQQVMSRLHKEQLKSEFIKRGVLPDRVDYLANEYVEQTEFALADAGPKLTKKGGVGDAAEFDAMIQEVKESKPFFFAADGASGSGASGSGQGGGGTPKTLTKAEVSKLDPAAKRDFYVNDGVISDD